MKLVRCKTSSRRRSPSSKSANPECCGHRPVLPERSGLAAPLFKDVIPDCPSRCALRDSQLTKDHIPIKVDIEHAKEREDKCNCPKTRKSTRKPTNCRFRRWKMSGDKFEGQSATSQYNEASIDQEAIQAGLDNLVEVRLALPQRKHLHNIGSRESRKQNRQDLQRDETRGQALLPRRRRRGNLNWNGHLYGHLRCRLCSVHSDPILIDIWHIGSLGGL